MIGYEDQMGDSQLAVRARKLIQHYEPLMLQALGSPLPPFALKMANLNTEIGKALRTQVVRFVHLSLRDGDWSIKKSQIATIGRGRR